MTAQQKWDMDLPVSLRQLAEIQRVPYKTAWKWTAALDFPIVCRLVRRTDFEAWWKRQLRHRRRGRHLHRGAGKSGEPPEMSDLRDALPPQSARLLDEALSRS